MPLSTFFAEQFQQLKDFMVSRTEVVRCVRVDPDFKEVFIKALVKIDEEPDNPHCIIPCDIPFENSVQYFNGLLNHFQEEYQKHAQDLEKQGVHFNVPYQKNDNLTSAVKYVRYVSTLAESMPDSVGSMVFLIEPKEIKDTEGFNFSIEYLANEIQSQWAKYLVLDSRVDPVLEGIEKRVENVEIQTFYLSPAEIENRTRSDLENSSKLTPLERRQYLGMLAGFEFGKKNYEEAAKLQQEWVTQTEHEGDPSEAANAYYNLGNTLFTQENYLAAEENFCKASNVCLNNNINAFLPLVLTNLGVTLHRQKRVPEAIQSLQVARDNFKAQNLKLGEAYVLDCLAALYQSEARNEEAEASWLEALSIFDGITSNAFTDVRNSGRNDILEKLERFYQATKQQNKIAELKQ